MDPEDRQPPKGKVRREIERNEREEKRQGPPKPPRREGPELRNKEGELERALVKKYKNGGCVMGNRGVRDTKMV
jgi:hypothetical protein